MRYFSRFLLVVVMLAISSQSTAFAQDLDTSETEACDQFSDLASLEDMATAYFDLAQNQPFEIAISSFNCAVQLNPEYAEAFYFLGRTHDVLGNYQLAINSYTAAIRLDYEPLSWPHVGRGLSNVELGRYRQAIGDYTRAIQLDPDFDVAWHGRGLAYFGLNNFDRAIENYDKAIELDDGQELAIYYSDRGMAYAGLGDYKQAIDDYTVSLAHNPQSVVPYYNRGLALYEESNYVLAIVDLTKAIEIDPEYAPAYYTRGLSLQRLGDNEQALLDFSKAIEITPEDAFAYVGRGDTYSLLGVNDLALADYHTALDLGLTDVALERLVFFNRGTIYIRLEEYEKAEMDLMKAMEIDPNNWETYERLGYLYQVQAMFPEALEQYQRYLELAGEEANPEVIERIEELENKLAPEAVLQLI